MNYWHNSLPFSTCCWKKEKRLVTSSAGIIRGQPVLCATCSGAGLLMASSRCWELEKKKSPKNLRHVHAVISIRFFVWKKTKRAVERSISYRLCKMDNFSCWPNSARPRADVIHPPWRRRRSLPKAGKSPPLVTGAITSLLSWWCVYSIYITAVNKLTLFSFQTVGLCCQLSVGVVKEKKDGKWVYPRKKRNKGVSINFSYTCHDSGRGRTYSGECTLADFERCRTGPGIKEERTFWIWN